MSKMSYELSDGLGSLRRSFAENMETGVSMTPCSLAVFVDTVRLLELRARDLENEVSRQRWNEAARTERVAS